MNLYLRRVHGEQSFSWLFAAAYGLCGYIIGYYYNIILTNGLEKGNVFRKIKRFCLDSCLSAGIAAIVIIPVLFVAKESGKQLEIPPLAFEINYNFAEFIKPSLFLVR